MESIDMPCIIIKRGSMTPIQKSPDEGIMLRRDTAMVLDVVSDRGALDTKWLQLMGDGAVKSTHHVTLRARADPIGPGCKRGYSPGNNVAVTQRTSFPCA